MREKRKLLLCICILLFLAGAVQAGVDCSRSRRHRQQQEALSNERETAEHAPQGKRAAGDRRLRLHIAGMAKGKTGVTDGRLAVTADTQIGDNDRAAVNVIRNSDGQAVGLVMVDDHDYGQCESKDAQFNLYFSGTGGGTGADTFWFGYLSYQNFCLFEQTDRENFETVLDGYGDYTFNEQGETISFGGSDSAIAFSWQNINLDAGQSVSYAVALGVAEKSEPPAGEEERPDEEEGKPGGGERPGEEESEADREEDAVDDNDHDSEIKESKDPEPKVGDTPALPLIPAGMITGMTYLMGNAVQRRRIRGRR